MSFLKEFKEDLSLAVSELLPQEVKEDEEDFGTEEDFREEIREKRKDVRSTPEKSQEKKVEEVKQKERTHQRNNEKKSQRMMERGREPAPKAESKERKSADKESGIKDVEIADSHPEKTDLKGEIDLEALLRKEPRSKQSFFKEEMPKESVPVKEEKLVKEEKTEKEAEELNFEKPETIDQKSEVTETAEVIETEKIKEEIVEEKKIMDEMMTGKVEAEEEVSLEGLDVMPEVEIDVPAPKKSNEVATITTGTKINGDIESDGSLEILGTINGNVTCNGKLTITGTIVGNSNADEVYADSAKVEGEINSGGAVKIGLGSVILGNVNATSAVIAGAIRGDIDVHGPVIVDTSAVVMGNIKSRSVQINNGAVIEGFCSQCYSDVSVKNFFEENKPIAEKKTGNGAHKK